MSSFQNQFLNSPPAVPRPADDFVTGPSPVGLTHDTIERVERRLEQLDALQESIASEVDYDVPPLPFQLPAGFLLSVIVPVFNERDTVTQLLGRVQALPVPLEIIVVDDCSTDGTRDVLARLASIPNVRVILKDRNEGKGAALRTGFGNANGDIVIVQDADLEYDPRDIPSLLQPIVENRADVVYGSRYLNRDLTVGSSGIHQFGNWVLTVLSNVMTGLELTDMETCYKAIRRDLIQSLNLEQNRFGFEPEVTAKLAKFDVRIEELPVRYAARDWDEGKKIGIKDAIATIYCIFRYSLFG